MKKIKINSFYFFAIFQLFTLAVYNESFFSSIHSKANAQNLDTYKILTTFLVAAFFANTFLTTLFFWKQTHKVALFILISLNALAAFYIKQYGIKIDSGIIESVFKTTPREASDFFTIKLAFHYTLTAITPYTVFIKIFEVEYVKFFKKLFYKIIQLFVCIVSVAVLYMLTSHTISSFVRNNRGLNYPIPLAYIVSTIDYMRLAFIKDVKSKEKTLIIQNTVTKPTNKKLTLFIFVMGEAARADRFQLNGYKKETNPNLSKIKDLINFEEVSSCETFTAKSLPCIFSHLNRKDFLSSKLNYQSILDIITETGFKVLWNENGSRDYGVIDKNNKNIEHFSTQELKDKKYCDTECHDEVLIYHNTKNFINKHNNKDLFIVLHQVGSHGPAYFLRKPKGFEKFKPECQNKEMSKCSREEISNAYDNTIHYTDYFLSEVIKLAKQYQNKYNIGVFYVSDHGQSLGEAGLYLHGAPYTIAPKAQTHVPMFFWLDDSFNSKKINLKKYTKTKVSHDNIFHTILGLLNIDNPYYKSSLDLSK